MIEARFHKKNSRISGFRVSGHSGYADRGSDIVCASVTSAVQLAANIITDGFHIPADAGVENNRDNAIFLNIPSPDDRSEAVLAMLIAQLDAILREFPDTINISISEV